MTRKAFRFFHENAGYVVGQRAIGAAALARAEEKAADAGITFRWEHDHDPDISWMSETEKKQDHEILGCMAMSVCGECGQRKQLASLWGIVDPSNEYRRVIEAELALEAI